MSLHFEMQKLNLNSIFALGKVRLRLSGICNLQSRQQLLLFTLEQKYARMSVYAQLCPYDVPCPVHAHKRINNTRKSKRERDKICRQRQRERERKKAKERERRYAHKMCVMCVPEVRIVVCWCRSRAQLGQWRVGNSWQR